MVRKQNERTILLQYRIIPLSLPTKTLFLILASRPLSTRLGAFSSPETFPHKFFPKFFPIKPRRLFSVFLVRKIMGAKGSWRSPNGGGGCPFSYALHIANWLLFYPPFRLPFLPSSWQIFRQTGQKGAKVNFSLVVVGVFSGKSETATGKNLIYF